MMSELNPKWQFFHDTINLKHTRICKLQDNADLIITNESFGD